MDINVATRTKSGRTILQVSGEIDVSTAPRLRDEMSRVMSETEQDLVIDLCDVPFLDSTGLGVLVGRLKVLRNQSRDMVLVTDQERTLRNFRITGLDKLFRIYSSVDAALKAPTGAETASSM